MVVTVLVSFVVGVDDLDRLLLHFLLLFWLLLFWLFWFFLFLGFLLALAFNRFLLSGLHRGHLDFNLRLIDDWFHELLFREKERFEISIYY